MNDELLTATDHPSLYVSRRVPLAPSRAGAAFDHLCGEGDVRARLGAPVGTLTVEDGDASVPWVPDGAPVRRARARLRTGRWRRVRVEVELLPWSRSESELGLRPLGRRLGTAWAPTSVGRRYFDAALAALEHVAGRLEHLAPAVAEPADSGSRTPRAAA